MLPAFILSQEPHCPLQAKEDQEVKGVIDIKEIFETGAPLPTVQGQRKKSKSGIHLNGTQIEQQIEPHQNQEQPSGALSPQIEPCNEQHSIKPIVGMQEAGSRSTQHNGHSTNALPVFLKEIDTQQPQKEGEENILTVRIKQLPPIHSQIKGDLRKDSENK